MSASLRILVLGAACLPLAACASHGAPPAATPVGLTGQPIAAPAGEARSLFAAPWVWTDEQGASVSFEKWRGAPIIVSMVFTNCTTACPLTIDKLRQASETFKREGRAATFVLVTLDPADDTPDQLRRFKASRQLPAEWHLLRGSDDATHELAHLLQVKVVDNAHIFHDSRIVLFDADGRLAGQLRG